MPHIAYFAVVTRVAAPERGGNLACPFGSLYQQVEEGNAENGWLGVFKPVDVLVAFALREPVFHVGEILLMGANDREVGHSDRKPSKWDVDIERFDTLEAAVERSHELVGR